MQFKLKKNLDSPDRLIRGATALIILGLYTSGLIQGIIGNILLVLAGMLTLSGTSGYCPLLTWFGFNNRRK